MVCFSFVLQWGRGLSPAEIGYAGVKQTHTESLQWGRGLSPAEICIMSRTPAALLLASMGPRALARGNHNAGIHAWNQLYASMGPRALARGNQDTNDRKRQAANASMGPRALARGNNNMTAPITMGR